MMLIRTIVTYQAYCDTCGHGAGPPCDTVEQAERFLASHNRTNYHKRNAEKP